MFYQTLRLKPMKFISFILLLILFLVSSCTSQKKLAYLNNLPTPSGEERFTMDIPDYKIQKRDILNITLKAMNPEGMIMDYLGGSGGTATAYTQGESSGYLFGYNVNKDGNIILPVIGSILAEGKTLEEIRILLQEEFSKNYKNAVVECKLLSFKFTIIGEVKAPGTYLNYNNYLTVLEAIGRAGGIDDYGRRDKILVIRPTEGGTKTYTLNLQDKKILSSEAYFLLPNDVIIVEPESKKIFTLNLPTISFVIGTFTSVLTTTLLLINYFGK
jgi:polysaccharide biosynthesis/export protein